MAKSARPGKVFIDWSQNNGSKTTNAPYSLRGRAHPTDRKSVVHGKSVSVRVDLGGRRIIKKKNHYQVKRWYTVRLNNIFSSYALNTYVYYKIYYIINFIGHNVS